MNLFMIIYSASQIGGVIGPLTYGIDECRAHVADMHQKRIEAVASGSLDGDEISRVMDLRFECEFHDDRPVIGEAAE